MIWDAREQVLRRHEAEDVKEHVYVQAATHLRLHGAVGSQDITEEATTTCARCNAV